MPSRRCATCGINYPIEANTATCPVHKEDMGWMARDADTDWYERMRDVKMQFDRVERAAGLFPTIPEAPVSEKNGRYFISTWDVHAQECMPSALNAGDLLQVGDEVYEIEGRIESLRMYYMRRFAVEVTDENLTAFRKTLRRRRRKKTK